jgi:serine protease Do
MKDVTKLTLTGIVVFAAVVAGMQVDRTLRARQADISTVLNAAPVTKVDYEVQAGAPADFRAPVAKISPSVVSVDRYDQVNDFFGESRGVQQTGTGSGVIISNDGYILTNNHVVENADRVQVRLTDDRALSAKVIGTDPRSDLAVLKVEAKNLAPATLGDSSKLQVGEWVIAIGNPLGYDNTVSVGVVSNLNRTLQTGRNTLLVDGIQTDAAINKGNSGGALANIRGELVGINSAIISNTGGSIGLGFAIPVNQAKRVANEIIKFGRVRYGTLGVALIDRPGLLDMDFAREQIQDYTGATPPRQGVVVRGVERASAAAQLGLQQIDILLKIDGQPLNLPIDLTKALMNKRPGDKVRLTYWSKGQTKTVEVELKEPLQAL